ncbi:MAG: hypothetical protein CSA70_02665 [Rhodobacterales bacterium]|nr:MAG: hypothetical protein CSA70_02665 [Rhodobacterales bacterium]
MGQEYRALFGTTALGYRRQYLHHYGHVLRKGGEKISFARCNQMIADAAYLRSRRADVTYVMIEPNPNLFARPIYREADIALCIALSDNPNAASLMKLYFANKDRTGQGSSLFEAKPNVSLDDYTTVINVNASHFARMIKDAYEAEHGTDYCVILRLNNEGAEVEVIKSFEATFGPRLEGVLGSLADVAKVHGQPELNAIYDFMKSKGIPFIPLYSAFTSWPDAIAFVRGKVEGTL